MVWAIALLLVLLMPGYAFAEPATEAQVSQVDTTQLEESLERLKELETEQGTTLSTIETTLTSINNRMDEQQREQEQQEKDAEGDKTTEDYLIDVTQTLDAISGKLDAPEQQEQTSLTRAQSFDIVAYSNVSPTGAYATYASGLIPRMKWDDHYVFVQDTSSSYTLIWGSDLAYTDTNTFAGSQCVYVRWFYSGSSSGYLTESGTADVSVSTAGHVVLSDLARYPMLEGTEQHAFRVEVAFYVCVALVIRTLHHVWRFTLRNGNGTMAD